MGVRFTHVLALPDKRNFDQFFDLPSRRFDLLLPGFEIEELETSVGHRIVQTAETSADHPRILLDRDEIIFDTVGLERLLLSLEFCTHLLHLLFEEGCGRSCRITQQSGFVVDIDVGVGVGQQLSDCRVAVPNPD